MVIQGNLMFSHLEIEMAANFPCKNTNNNTNNNSKRRTGATILLIF